jgi:hypothetical protein
MSKSKPTHRPMDIQPEQALGVCQSAPTASPDADKPRAAPNSKIRKAHLNPASAEISRQKSMKTQRAILARKKASTLRKQG